MRRLATRLAVMMFALSAGAALAGIAAVWIITGGLERRELGRALDRSHEVVDGALQRRLELLELVVGLLGRDPPFRAYVTEGTPLRSDNLRSGCRLGPRCVLRHRPRGRPGGYPLAGAGDRPGRGPLRRSGARGER
jgi:hypothetical protein